MSLAYSMLGNFTYYEQEIAFVVGLTLHLTCMHGNNVTEMISVHSDVSNVQVHVEH